MRSYRPALFHQTAEEYYEEVQLMEKQKELLYSYLPVPYQQMQRKAEEACDRMEFEGSRLYDEHPDQNVLRHMAKSLMEELLLTDSSFQDSKDSYQEDMMYSFLCNEIVHRRWRKWISRKYIR